MWNMEKQEEQKRVQPKRVSSGKRIVGYDIARCLAVFGMVAVNYKLVIGSTTDSDSLLAAFTELFEGRAAPLFVMLAGIGISLVSSRNRTTQNFQGLRENRMMLLRRAIFLFVVGISYTPIWPADILHFYGVYIGICAFLLSVSNRCLWSSASFFVFGFLILLLFFDYEQGWNWETLEYSAFWTVHGMVRHIFFNGFHPVFPWTAFLLVGMWLGRQEMSHPVFRKKIILVSVPVVLVAEILSSNLVRLFSVDASPEQKELVASLFGTSPMPPMPLYLLSSGATAIIIISLCVTLAEQCHGKWWMKPLIATGQLGLTNYVAHVVIGMGILEELDLLGNGSLPFALGCAVTFCFAALLFSHFCLLKFSRGPLEWCMRKITG